MDPQPTPDAILELGLAFWGSKAFLSAIELGVFTLLAEHGPMECEEVAERAGLHPRAARDFLDALVALKVLERDGLYYQNTPAGAAFLNRGRDTYLGGFLEMAGQRLYGFWGSLSDALRTGQPQNEARFGGDVFAKIYADPSRLEGFLQAMTGVSLSSARAIAEKFPWGDFSSFVDVGAAQGALPVQVALAHPHLCGTGYDLPPVKPHYEAYVAKYALADRLQFQAGDFFLDRLPTADVIVMGHVLHDWDLETKRMLIGKAHAALPTGGALVVYDAIIDDGRRENAFGLLMSLNMLIETTGGFDYTAADATRWLTEAGFRSIRTEHLCGPESMIVAIK